MRYSSSHKTETRQRILTMAALRFRAEGVANVGIANLMADLGLTHGGFYAHFHSKDDLVAQSCRQALLDMNEIWQAQLEQAPSGAGVKRLAKDYLSAAHRDFRIPAAPPPRWPASWPATTNPRARPFPKDCRPCCTRCGKRSNATPPPAPGRRWRPRPAWR